jgi:hypothetical protein
MTKARAPLSIDAALARIAGQLPGGYDEAAQVAKRKVRTVRNWGDPDTPEQIPLDCAIALDLAYEAAGGEGYPLHETYGAQLQLAEATHFATRFDLLRRTAALIKEGGEAHAALARLCLPDSSDADRRLAHRELAEAFEAIAQVLPLLETSPTRDDARPAALSLNSDRARAPP